MKVPKKKPVAKKKPAAGKKVVARRKPASRVAAAVTRKPFVQKVPAEVRALFEACKSGSNQQVLAAMQKLKAPVMKDLLTGLNWRSEQGQRVLKGLSQAKPMWGIRPSAWGFDPPDDWEPVIPYVPDIILDPIIDLDDIRHILICCFCCSCSCDCWPPWRCHCCHHRISWSQIVDPPATYAPRQHDIFGAAHSGTGDVMKVSIHDAASGHAGLIVGQAKCTDNVTTVDDLQTKLIDLTDGNKCITRIDAQTTSPAVSTQPGPDGLPCISITTTGTWPTVDTAKVIVIATGWVESGGGWVSNLHMKAFSVTRVGNQFVAEIALCDSSGCDYDSAILYWNAKTLHLTVQILA